jgi:photosystem II stability/assembly factor-like uncharacterized protein
MKRILRSWIPFFIAILLIGLFSGGRASAAGIRKDAGILYQDDFESASTGAWDLAQGWQVALDGDNHVLQGRGHANANLLAVSETAGIQDFEFRYQLPGGSAHVNYHLDLHGSRYFVRLEQNAIALNKSVLKPDAPTQGDRFDHPQLARADAQAGGSQWHSLAIAGQDNHLTVRLDGAVVIDYTDEQNPYRSGGVGFESLDDTQVLRIDDVVVRGTASADESAGPEWIFTGGPRGGIGYDLRIDPRLNGILWVTDAYAGANQSLDNGVTWQSKNQGITGRAGFSGDAVPIFSLTIDPRNPDVLWAGTQGMRGVYKSVDGGQTWAEMDNGIQTQPNMEFRGFTVDPANSDVVYCGGNYLADTARGSQRGFLYRTGDGGKNWTLLAEPQALIRWIIVDPGDSRVIYLSTGIFDRFAVKPEGVLKSMDGGQTWQAMNTGLTSLAVGALTMHPADSQTLMAGTGKAGYFLDDPNELYGGVFKTSDGGQHWKQVLPGAGSKEELRFSAIAYAPSNPEIVYADAGYVFYRSSDGGEHWVRYSVEAGSNAVNGENRGQPIALVVDPKDPNRILMNAYDGGVFISSDGGQTWKDASRGYSGAQTWSIAVHPSDPARVLVASKNGVHLSTDGGQTWQGVINHPLLNNILAVAFDPSNDHTFVAGQEIVGFIARSTDAGAHWTIPQKSTGQDVPNGRRSVYQIAFAPSHPAVVYAATGIDTITVDIPRDTDGPGVLKSSDDGVTWAPANTGLAAAHFNVLAVAVDPNDENTVYAGTLSDGIYKTVDGGGHWSAVNSGLGPREIRSVALDPRHPEIVYAGAGGAGVWRSPDGGASWQQTSLGLPPEANIFGLVVDPTQSDVIYAADRFSGVYASQDGGQTWARMNRGLQMRAVNELAISADGQHLYAATEGHGVYRLDFNGKAPQAAAPQPAAQATSAVGSAIVPVLSTAVAQIAPTPAPEQTSAGQGLPAGWLFAGAGGIVLLLIGVLAARRRSKTK